MTMMRKTLLSLLLVSSVFSIATSTRRHSNSNIDWWCSQTPYPEPCKYYMQQTHYHHKLKHRSEFRAILVHLALERAVIMRRKARDLGHNGIAKKQKSVFRDCLKLYDNTVFHLNRTLDGLREKRSCSPFDAQTWLSTARTNIETCQNGALELGVEDFMVPTERCNVTEIISNGLFVNWAFLKYEAVHYTEDAEADFPSWFSMHERKLLQSSSIRAHLVVAKDGSGHFKSVQAAINAASETRRVL